MFDKSKKEEEKKWMFEGENLLKLSSFHFLQNVWNIL